MIIYEYLMKAIQDDARRADERNRLLLEARRPRRAPRQRLVGFRAGGWIGLIGNSPQLAKLALDEALAAGSFLLGRRSYSRKEAIPRGRRRGHRDTEYLRKRTDQ